MTTVQDENLQKLSGDPLATNVSTDAQMSVSEEYFDCNKCGICCTRLRVSLSFIEAHRIADSLGVTWNDFRNTYLESDDLGDTAFFIRHQSGACIFLRFEEDQSTSCAIQPFKPLSCIQCNASLQRSICREGQTRQLNRLLNPNMNIGINPEPPMSGNIEQINMV